MMICTFFGHRYFDETYIPKLKQTIENLIINKNVNKFYVGNNGQYDAVVEKLLKEFEKKYPHIKYYIVLAYLPRELEKEGYHKDFSRSIMYDGFERIPPRAAIIKRNNWMLSKADFVVCYITRTALSGAAVFAEKAKVKNKICINIAE